MAGWLTAPLELHSSRMFECGDFTPEDCEYYQYRWRFWYQADYVYALPTIAFFLCVIGVFIIARLTLFLFAPRKSHGPPLWRRAIAASRYLTYRGFHVKSLKWNSAPVGVLLLAAVGALFFIFMVLIPQPYYWPSLDFGGSPPLATRSGWMALACMPFLFATASKTNWITLLTGVPHEKLQVFHRWTAYAFFVLALIHTFPFIVYHIRFHDMVMQFEMGLIFYWTGIVALIFQAWLTFASFSTFRNRGYEFFKAAHFFSAVVFVLIFFWHCNYTLTSWDYFIATAAVYVPCLVYPWLRTCFEYGLGQKAQLFVEDNGFTRITIPANFDWVPGQHCFLRFRTFGLHALTSHPFTICSLPATSPGEKSQITFYIRHRGGFTARLYNYAMKQPGISVPVLVDGPYGGIDPEKYYSSDRLIVIAGGSGAGWILPFIEQFVRCSLFRDGKQQPQDSQPGVKEEVNSEEPLIHGDSVGPRSLRVILATRETVTREWFQQAVNSVISRYPSLSTPFDIEVQVHLTSKTDTGSTSSDVFDLEITSSSSSTKSSTQKPKGGNPKNHISNVTDKDSFGRPHLPGIIHDEASKTAETGKSLGVFVCGPVSMQNDVRNAVASENLKIVQSPRSGGVYLHLEHFQWA